MGSTPLIIRQSHLAGLPIDIESGRTGQLESFPDGLKFHFIKNQAQVPNVGSVCVAEAAHPLEESINVRVVPFWGIVGVYDEMHGRVEDRK